MEQTAFLSVFSGLVFYFGGFYKISYVSDTAEQKMCENWDLFLLRVCVLHWEETGITGTVICEM